MQNRFSQFIEKHPVKSAIVFYSIFFFALFIQLPLKKMISGNCDTWLALLSGYSFEAVKSFFTGERFGIPMYPASNPLSYGESAPGIQIIIILLKLLGLPDYWTNYFFISLIFMLTAVSIFIFAGNFSKKFSIKLFAGFIFTCSNMSFAHIDDPIIIFFFLPVLALHFIYKWFEEKKSDYLLFSAICAGIEIYFSFYVFFYQFLMLAVLSFVTVYSKHYKIRDLIKPAIFYFFIIIPIAAPHFIFYFYTLWGLDFVTPFDMFYTAKMASLNPVDLILVLPNNLIYPNIGEQLGIPMNWGFVRHYNFTGLLALALFSYSLFKWNEHRLLFGLMAVTGIFFAMGPVFMFNMEEVLYSPLYIFYKWIPVLSFLRVAARSHFIFLFALSIGSAVSAERILSRSNKKIFLTALFFIAHFFENTPMPLKGFDASITEKVPAIYQAVQVKNPNALILELPSTMKIEYLNWDEEKFSNPADFVVKNPKNPKLLIENMGMFVDSWDDIFQYNREIIYTNWLIRHKINSVNGINGYFPTPRVMYQYYINLLPEKKAFYYLKKWGIDYIIWHDFLKIKADQMSLEKLENSGCVKRIYAAEKSYLFEIKECNE